MRERKDVARKRKREREENKKVGERKRERERQLSATKKSVAKSILPDELR